MTSPAADAAFGWHTREHTVTFGSPLADGSRTLAWHGAALMGIVNVTPDSFSDGGRLVALDDAIEAGLRQAAEGALIVDVGGESTRPGAKDVTVDEELDRVLPVVEALAAEGVLVSVDTRKPRVAAAALAAGARLVNDVGGLRDPAMVAACAAAGAPAVIVHMQGEPATMQVAPHYDDVVGEVEAFLLGSARAATAGGVPAVLVDPGIGFGKTVEHNLTLIAATGRLAGHGHCLLVGASRKGFLDLVADVPQPGQRLGATLAAHLLAARHGAAMLRVHDVEQHRQALLVEAALSAAGEGSR